MQRRLHCAAAALLAMLFVHTLAGPSLAQQPDSRKLVIARQDIRTELAEALADGGLTPEQQYKILLHAKETLPPEDVQGLERTMIRLAEKNRLAHSHAASAGDIQLTSAEAIPRPVPLAGSLQYDTPGMGPRTRDNGNPFQEESADEVAMASWGDDNVFAVCNGSVIGGDGCFRENWESVFEQIWHNATFQTGVDGFKGPVDLFVPNGNFGVDFGFNLGVPLARQIGLGVQVGMSEVLSDFQGTVQDEDFSTPTSQIRRETFTTLGLYQRIPINCKVFSWGFTHDWLRDDYYSPLKFAQWRVKLAVEFNPWNEVGIWAAMPDHGDSAFIASSAGAQPVEFDYRSMAQGNLYWRHTFCNDASITARAGIAQEPGGAILGAEARLPLTERLSMVGNFTYIAPRSGGVNGQLDELWNISCGIELVPGGVRHCPKYQFSPLMPVADNGTMAVRVLQ